jgi:hypothetical protein
MITPQPAVEAFERGHTDAAVPHTAQLPEPESFVDANRDPALMDTLVGGGGPVDDSDGRGPSKS